MIAVRFRCPECKKEGYVREDRLGADVLCPHCHGHLTVPRRGTLPAPGSDEPQAPPAEPRVMPWPPVRMLGAAFLFGPLAAGVLTGMNFARMGKRKYLAPCAAAGAALFALVLLAAVLLRDAADAAWLLANLIVAAGFMLVQKKTFDVWKATNLTPARGGPRYRPAGLVRLVVVGLTCLAVEALAFLVLIHLV